MPVRIRSLDKGAGIEFYAHGRVTGQDIIDANRNAYTEETLRKISYQFIDRTDCTEYNVSPGQMRTISRQEVEASQINPDIKIIIVAPSSFQYGMTRMYGTLSEESGFEFHIFRDRASAELFVRENIAGCIVAPES